MATTHTHTDKTLEDFAVHNVTGESFSRLLFEGCKKGGPTSSLFSDNDSTVLDSFPSKVSCFEKLEPRMEMGSSQNSDSKRKSSSLNCSDCGSKGWSKSDKKRKNAVARVAAGAGLGGAVGAPVGGDGSSCEERKEETYLGGNGKRRNVRRRALGEGVAALHRLVCPNNGKTDAATVLHEAKGYIRFLQEQVKVLCFFYLQNQIRSDCHSCDDGRESRDEYKDSPGGNLKSKGLCLVPVECITTLIHN
ncbi:Transcription factor bHLH113-like protein [Drosera capensis]